MYRLTRRIAAPAADPLTLAEACSALRLPTGIDDSGVTAALKAAVEHLEAAHGIACVAASGGASTHEDIWDDWPASVEAIRLQRSNVLAIASVTYRDSLNVVQTFSDWAAVGRDLWLKSGKAWPTTQLLTEGGAITITYRAGWADADSVPTPIKQAIRILLNHYYLNRDGSDDEKVNRAAATLVANFRCY